MKRQGWPIGSLLVGAALGLLVAACTDPPEIVIDQEATATSLAEARCGSGGILCGNLSACCAAGDGCTAAGRCAPDKSCTTSEECGADSTCGDGRCVPWSAFPDAAGFDPNCKEAADAGGVSRALPDLTVSVDPAVACIANQPRVRISLSLCNRGLLELPGGRASVAVVDATEPSRSLCELVDPNILRPGSCETLNCDVDGLGFPSAFDIAILADPAGSVSECTEGENNTARLSNIFCGRDP
ncbi:MAG TPA: hypothetical protein VJU61_22120 [Polyangiaceae bacterium]|nr:hypothetical protein [Polyangiaceae bacterium]